MPAKNVLTPYKLVSAADISVDSTSAAVNIQWLDNVSVQANLSGSPVGNLQIQGSLDYSQTPFNPAAAGTWVNVLPSAVAISASGSVLLNLDQLAFPWIRVQYLHTSGTGSMDVYISAKEI